MSWEKKPNGPVSWVQRVEGALRHPDGSPDITAYGRIAHHQRDAAIASAAREAAHSVRAIVSAVWRVLGRSGRIRSSAPLRG